MELLITFWISECFCFVLAGAFAGRIGHTFRLPSASFYNKSLYQLCDQAGLDDVGGAAMTRRMASSIYIYIYIEMGH